MTTEWLDLPDLQAVAIAQSKDWEIEVCWNEDDYWNSWGGQVWQDDINFRARPRQPKMRKVKMLCWLHENELYWLADGVVTDCKYWIRILAQDIEIEIPEGV